MEVETALPEGVDLGFEEMVDQFYGQVEDGPCGVHGVLRMLGRWRRTAAWLKMEAMLGGLGRLAVSVLAAGWLSGDVLCCEVSVQGLVQIYFTWGECPVHRYHGHLTFRGWLCTSTWFEKPSKVSRTCHGKFPAPELYNSESTLCKWIATSIAATGKGGQ